MIGSMEFTSALVSGACAGVSVDLALFPVDTIKTRLQSPQGFIKAGGFKKIYSGLGSTAVGSMPGAALFFCTYEGVKGLLSRHAQNDRQMALVHMTAASCGEITACVVRVPTEVVKQRAQASKQPSLHVLRETLHSERLRGLYRGYVSTVMREIPFSFIQFPLWEKLKRTWGQRQNRPLEAWQSGVCGAFSGAIAAALTTPLDVAKTRIMLAEKSTSLATGSIANAMSVVYKERGVKGLFAGVTPRVTWISIGGCVFLGVYDKMKMIMLGNVDVLS